MVEHTLEDTIRIVVKGMKKCVVSYHSIQRTTTSVVRVLRGYKQIILLGSDVKRACVESDDEISEAHP